MRAISGLKLVRYGALMSLSDDKRQVFLFAELISVSEENATYFTRSCTIFSTWHMSDYKHYHHSEEDYTYHAVHGHYWPSSFQLGILTFHGSSF